MKIQLFQFEPDPSTGQKKGGSVIPLLNLLGASILGSIVFITVAILLAPVFLVIVLVAMYYRWKINRALKKAAKQAEDMGVSPAGQPARKVTVTIVDDDKEA